MNSSHAARLLARFACICRNAIQSITAAESAELMASGSTMVSSPVLTGMLRMLTVVCVFFCGIFVLPVLELEELLLLLLFDGVAVGAGVDVLFVP